MLISRYSDRLEVEWGKLVRVVTGNPINKKYKNLGYDFYKIDEDGNAKCRNLYTSSYNGYRIAYPGVKNNDSYYGSIKSCYDDDFDDCREISCFPSKKLELHEKYMITEKYPDFIYVLNKWNGTISETLFVLRIWKEHPEIEMLLAAKYYNIAFNKSFWKQKKENRKAIVTWLRKHEYQDYTLNEVRIRIKYKLDYTLWEQYIIWNNEHWETHLINYDLYRYLLKQENKYGFDKNIYCIYQDYKDSFKSPYNFHSFKDDYWKFPKNLYEAHQRINEEIHTAIELERQKAEEQRAIDERNKLQRLRRIAKKYEKYNCCIDGYSIFISGLITEWNKQAKALHQCIVASDYYGKMAKKQLLIVFIQREGVPVATAEIKPGKVLGQFYADERGGPSKSTPSKEIQNVFNKYFEKLEIKGAI